MYKWKKQFNLETKILFQNKFFLVLPLLFAVWMGFTLYQTPYFKPDHIIVNTNDFHKLGHTMTLGIAMLIGILMIRRDIQSPTFEWIHSWPRSNGMAIITKFLAGFLYLSTFTVMMSIVYVGIASNVYGLSFQQYAAYFFHDILMYQWSYGVTLALAMFLAVTISHRIVYLIGFCAWMFGTYFIDIFIISRLNLPFLTTFHLNQYTLDTMLNNEVWGIHIFQKEIWTSRLFVASFAVMLLTVMIMLLNLKRATMHKTRSIILGMMSIVLVGLLFVPYGMYWADKFSTYQVVEADAFVPDDNYWNSGESSYQEIPIDSYDIHVLREDDDTLQVEATLTISQDGMPQGEELFFRLNPLLHLQEVSINGEKISYEREGSLITLSVMSDEIVGTDNSLHNIRFQYEGKIDMWAAPTNQQDNIFSFVNGDYVYLNGAIGWYPIPGNMPLFILNFGNDVRPYNSTFSYSYQQSLSQYAEFQLTLSNFTNNVYATIEAVDRNEREQVFYSKNTPGVTLVGGNLVEKEGEGQLSAVVNPFSKQDAYQIIEDISIATNFVENYFAIDNVLKAPVLILPNDGLGFWQYEAQYIDETYMIPAFRMYQYYRDDQSHPHSYRLMRDVIYNSLFKEFAPFKGTTFSRESYASILENGLFYLFLVDELNLTHDEFREAMYHVNTSYHFYMDDEDFYFSDSFYEGMSHEEVEEYQEGERRNKEAGRLLIETLEAGKIDKVREFLVELYENYVIPQKGMEEYYPIITPEEWEMEWNQVMADE
ncbi:hypothetical protein QA612_12950 [Evansella sp. AB-P1]|uniref:hypothetical protein n=1 Tax=Evansella sp. AB-P1 TaxID=3037653 RepID=UPI002420222C|nr:hypothetical protein [Evansella sp. AB-P1]MDG5788390.1 hypothetical protein [Evansella sp. AB-P1]